MPDAPLDPVRAQYEAFPYPERDPADEAKRLIEGSPSHPVEIDHFLFGGRRDWSRPFRVLVAGGGTGDGLIMLAQKLADIGCPAEITYVDMSEASRAVAEARAAARGLSIRFVTGDLLDAPALGPFDYIDCCGVLHHLPDPDAGFEALAGALAPDGGVGLMVYAPLGRSGVYPLQSAFAALLGDRPVTDRIPAARAILDALPEAHPFRRNIVLGDHQISDAGLYDLLLHARDRAYTAGDLMRTLERTGLALAGFVEGARYRPESYLPDPAPYRDRLKALSDPDRADVAESLSGTLKVHVAYATRAGAKGTVARPTRREAVPHLAGLDPAALAQQIARHGRLTARFDNQPMTVAIPREAAPLAARIDGRRTLVRIAGRTDWIAFQSLWAPLDRALSGFNLMHYSAGARR